MTKVGERVGAIQKANADTVWLYGFGVYEGDETPPIAPFGLTKEEWEKSVGVGVPYNKNPKIKLDNGKVVWGLQCWWGPEDTIIRKIDNRVVIDVDPEEEVNNAPK